MEDEVLNTEVQTDEYLFNQDSIFGNDRYNMTSEYENEDETEDEDTTEETDTPSGFVEETDTPEAPETTNETDVDFSVEAPSIFDGREIAETFKSDKHRADFYESAYKKSVEVLNGEVKNTFLNAFKSELQQIELNTEIAKEATQALESGNSMDFLRKYFGKELQQRGYNLKYSDDEIQDVVHQQLSQKFGSDYQDRYDINQVRLVNSESYKMFKEQERIVAQMEKENEAYLEQPKQQEVTPQMSDQERSQYIESHYKDFEKVGMAKEDYDKWVNEDLPTFSQKLTLFDMFKLQNMPQLIEQARLEERKKLVKEISNAGGKKVTYDDEPKQSSGKAKYNTIHEYYRQKDIQLNNQFHN